MNVKQMFRLLILALLMSTCSSLARAQYSGLYTFNVNWDGCCAYYADLLAQGTDGNIHGTMPVGTWAAPYGSWFDYTRPNGGVTIHPLTSPTQPQDPYSGLTLGVDGNLYGASVHGGASTGNGSTYGSIFTISNGVITTIYKFTGGANGSYPYAPPVQAPDGNLYGVTYDPANTGYVYQVLTATGTLGWVHPLPAGSRAPLMLANDGNMYGTVPYGGFTINGVAPLNNSGGAVFQVTLGGALTGIYNINGSSSNNNGKGDGFRTWGPVIQGSDSNLYGTASAGGAYSGGTLYKVALNGTGYTVIHNFQFADGTAPTGGLMQGSDGYLYGLTTAGGTLKLILGQPQLTPGGTLFKLDTTGANFSRLYTFSQNNINYQGSGMYPYATPVLHTIGMIYGLTLSSGTGTTSVNQPGSYDDGGELFSFNPDMAPFISVVGQRAARTGDRLSIIGQGFLNATSVTFGGVPATWGKWTVIVWSDNFMTVVVPPGAKTGKVVVQEPYSSPSTVYDFTIVCTSIACAHHF